MNFLEAKVEACVYNPQQRCEYKYALDRQPAAHRCKNGCIYEILSTFCEFGFFIGSIYDLQCSINFLINRDAKLGFGLLIITFSEETSVKVCFYLMSNN